MTGYLPCGGRSNQDVLDATFILNVWRIAQMRTYTSIQIYFSCNQNQKLHQNALELLSYFGCDERLILIGANKSRWIDEQIWAIKQSSKVVLCAESIDYLQTEVSSLPHSQPPLFPFCFLTQTKTMKGADRAKKLLLQNLQ